MIEDYELIRKLSEEDVEILIEKGKTYGSSWRKRGGVGAFMMLCRKWDRIENIAREEEYNIFQAVADNKGDILDDIQDLRRYLFLVEAFVSSRQTEAEMTAYIDPDRDLMGV